MLAKVMNGKQIDNMIDMVINHVKTENIQLAISQAWEKIAPWWPLKNLIATNPLQGFESLPFEQALTEAEKYFQNNLTINKLENINIQTIKWCQVFFDQGQATIVMPNRQQGLYNAWRELIPFDKQLHKNNVEHKNFINNLPLKSEDVIITCLNKLNIQDNDRAEFLTLLLTTLPGWASYIKYQNEWTQNYITHKHVIGQAEYLALRLVITCVLWPHAQELLKQYKRQTSLKNQDTMETVLKNEKRYRDELIISLNRNNDAREECQTNIPDAQLVFCIDVRSEPIRRAIESEGNYDTYGFAGFFGIPTIIHNEGTGESYASCPVLISPKHKVNKVSSSNNNEDHFFSNIQEYTNQSRKLYQALKYTLSTPFILAEAMGPWSGIWMTLLTFFPVMMKRFSSAINNKNTLQKKSILVKLDIDNHGLGISLNDQCNYAENALRMIGLTSNFSRLIVFCGHGATTENNAYASALDCGACGGHDGALNAKILAEILNDAAVRERLKENGIFIPNDTRFIAALHDTTTDTVDFLDSVHGDEILLNLKNALQRAKYKNNQSRIKNLSKSPSKNIVYDISKRSSDWSQTRPEWALARNAAFIIGPRQATKNINLQGRTFLHSYDWKQDMAGDSLTTILTAPMVVAQWINCQYFFSTLDNATYGSGSKITHNVVGKIAIMQGNASDLMSGLPLQSVMKNDQQPYHDLQRLLTIVYAPKQMVSDIIQKQNVLKKLFGNGWVLLVCIDPIDGITYQLQKNFSWDKVDLDAIKLYGLHDYV